MKLSRRVVVVSTQLRERKVGSISHHDSIHDHTLTVAAAARDGAGIVDGFVLMYLNIFLRAFLEYSTDCMDA